MPLELDLDLTTGAAVPEIMNSPGTVYRPYYQVCGVASLLGIPI